MIFVIQEHDHRIDLLNYNLENYGYIVVNLFKMSKVFVILKVLGVFIYL